jgi:pyridoxamine 5'-phosphate oxidase
MITKSNLKQNPIDQFKLWFEEANAKGIKKAESFSLATSTKDGKPSVRILLFKGLNNKGFKFYTNFESMKAKDLENNPQASMLFYWSPLERQVRIDGVVQKLSEKENDMYWSTRPRGSQIGAHSSTQSSVVNSREELENRFNEVEKQFEGKDIPRPNYWGGYILIPESIEFWEGLPNRLHDRILYQHKNNSWQLKRLAP